MASFKASAVAAHNSEQDCWIIIHDKVYDVTKFLDDHPGGPDIIADGAGKDLTEQFEDTGHSEDARKDLIKYFKGDVEKAPGDADDAKKASKKSSGHSHAAAPAQASAPINPFLVVVMVVIAIGGIFILLNP